ncbi:MAG: substrate-binding domain-containing protein [Streptosporangiaceae bacterium]
MRMLGKLITGAAVLATVTTLTAGVALADPPSGTTPKTTDVVGVGSNTTESLLDQLTLNYDSAHKTGTHIFSWDALENAAATTSGNIATKSGCVAAPRPNGSSAGIAALAANIKDPKSKSHFCLDFARSSRSEKSTDPTGLSFIPLALDNISYASVTKNPKTPKGSNAPTNLSTHQLQEIYTCTVTKWSQVGGKSTATIKPLLPQPGSGTLATFLADIGVTAFGKCVNEPNSLEENEGVDPIFTGANAANEIVPISAGKWLAQAYHSAACKSAKCGTDKSGVFTECKAPKKGQNKFGCDINGVLKVNDINKTAPINGTGAKAILNPLYTRTFIRTLFDVVRTAKAKDGIPSYLDGFFGAKGFFCSKAEKSVIQAYGYEPTASCG